MASPKAEIDLKDGHALPATKLAGGVRVKAHKHHSNGEKVRTNSESLEVEESGSPKQHPIISGAQTKGNSDFKAEAIRSYQEKPMKIPNQMMNGKRDNVIQQPKKF